MLYRRPFVGPPASVAPLTEGCKGTNQHSTPSQCDTQPSNHQQPRHRGKHTRAQRTGRTGQSNPPSRFSSLNQPPTNPTHACAVPAKLLHDFEDLGWGNESTAEITRLVQYLRATSHQRQAVTSLLAANLQDAYPHAHPAIVDLFATGLRGVSDAMREAAAGALGSRPNARQILREIGRTPVEPPAFEVGLPNGTVPHTAFIPFDAQGWRSHVG